MKNLCLKIVLITSAIMQRPGRFSEEERHGVGGECRGHTREARDKVKSIWRVAN